MKKIGLILGVVCLMNSSLVASARGNGIQIAKDGKALTKIILPEKPTKTEIFSSKELQRYLKKITGADLVVVSEKDASSGIYIGRTSPGTTAIKTHKLHKKDIDSFLMEAKRKNLVLVGNCDRSTLYAVYTFLEKLGCMWLSPGIEEIPKKSILAVSSFSQIEEPAFRYRAFKVFTKVPHYNNEWYQLCLDWSVKQKMNFEYRGHVRTLISTYDYVQKRGGFRGINHTHYTRILLSKELHKKHPEWFALVDGKRVWRRHSQPCTTNPEYIDFVAEHIKKFFAARPEIEVFPLTQSDGRKFCECPKCTALDGGRVITGKEYQRGEPVITERWLTFVNQVAKKVAKEYPDKKLYTLAYGATFPPPDAKRVKPEPNVSVLVCHGDCFLHEYTNEDCPANVKFLKDLKKWVDMTKGGISVYDYYPCAYMGQQPYIAYKKIYSDLKKIKQMGVVGSMPQVSSQILGTYLVDQYAFCKAMWNPEKNPEVVMAKFFNAMYKESAGSVKKFCDFLEEKREICPEHSKGRYILPYLTGSVIKEAEPYINKAMKAARSDKIRLRVQVLQDNFLVAKGYRLAFNAFSQYEKTGKLSFLKEAIDQFKKVKTLAEEADKDAFRKRYGLLWRVFRLGKGIYPDGYILKWEGMLKNYNLQIPYKEGIKTGVYLGSFGADKIVSALSKVKGINAFLLPRLDENTISSCRVVIISNTGNMADKFNQRAEELRNWVKKGGRIMLLHDAVGYRGHKAIIFPEIGKGKRNPHIKQVEAAKAHPITEDLKIGENFPHSYYDHIAIAPGEGGEIIIKDEKNNAVVVAGKVGKGKVVLNGMITGYGKFVSGKEGEMEPTGGELKILINAVKWLGSK